MKTKILLIAALAAVMAVTACTKDSGSSTTPSLSVQPTQLSFAAESAAAQAIAVTANCQWQASATASWITVSPAEGNGNGNVTVNVQDNADATSRTGAVKFTYGNAVTEVAVKQEAKTISDPTKITNAAEFLEMLARPQSATCDTTYTIMNDIDFTGVTITPENNFKGNFYATLDGQGHNFKNYTATSDMISYINGTVKDITIESGSFTMEPNHSCGIFCEKVEKGGLAENLINKVDITGSPSTTDTYHQGAICGICRGHMKGCMNYGDIVINLSQTAKKHYRLAGIAGSTAPENNTGDVALENCENHGNIEITCVDAKAYIYLAGITGVADSKGCTFTINGCVNKGKLSITNPNGFDSSSARAYVGGLVGQRNEGEIKNCSFAGEIDLTALNFNLVFVGGLVAFQKSGYSGEAFQGCTVIGNIKASYENVSSTTTNPLAYAGLIVGSVGDAGVTFGGVSDQAIKVAASLYNGDTEIVPTEQNLKELAIGSASPSTPTINAVLDN